MCEAVREMRWEKEVRIDQARTKPCSGIQTLSKDREVLGVFIQENDQICFWRAHQGYNEGNRLRMAGVGRWEVLIPLL